MSVVAGLLKKKNCWLQILGRWPLPRFRYDTLMRLGWKGPGPRGLRKVLITAFGVFFSSRRRHTRLQGDWSSDVCSSDPSRRRNRDYKVTGVQTCALPI